MCVENERYLGLVWHTFEAPGLMSGRWERLGVLKPEPRRIAPGVAMCLNYANRMKKPWSARISTSVHKGDFREPEQSPRRLPPADPPGSLRCLCPVVKGQPLWQGSHGQSSSRILPARRMMPVQGDVGSCRSEEAEARRGVSVSRPTLQACLSKPTSIQNAFHRPLIEVSLAAQSMGRPRAAASYLQIQGFPHGAKSTCVRCVMIRTAYDGYVHRKSQPFVNNPPPLFPPSLPIPCLSSSIPASLVSS